MKRNVSVLLAFLLLLGAAWYRFRRSEKIYCQGVPIYKHDVMVILPAHLVQDPADRPEFELYRFHNMKTGQLLAITYVRVLGQSADEFVDEQLRKVDELIGDKYQLIKKQKAERNGHSCIEYVCKLKSIMTSQSPEGVPVLFINSALAVTRTFEINGAFVNVQATEYDWSPDKMPMDKVIPILEALLNEVRIKDEIPAEFKPESI